MTKLQPQHNELIRAIAGGAPWMTPAEAAHATATVTAALHDIANLPLHNTTLVLLRLENMIHARTILRRVEAQLTAQPDKDGNAPAPPDWLLRNLTAARKTYHEALSQYNEIFTTPARARTEEAEHIPRPIGSRPRSAQPAAPSSTDEYPVETPAPSPSHPQAAPSHTGPTPHRRYFSARDKPDQKVTAA